MAFSTGTKVGSYEILGLLGKGGMGEVYRARDNKLKREVAIKVLPDTFTRDDERVSRLQHEAQVLASLNDIHIATIYHIEHIDASPLLILELVEGETLAERIAKGPLPAMECLSIAKQIAEALEAAHDKGIIHRDLKPANIKITPSGVVKVLDFGLAKVTTADISAIGLSDLPTSSGLNTSEGVIVGTASYMSPEQVRGKTLDKRTDIWSFGCILYEMFTGQQPFHAATVSDVLAAVLNRDPVWDALPNSIRRTVQRCLEKDSSRRPRDIGDIRLEIEHAQAADSRASAPSFRLLVLVGTVVTLALVALIVEMRYPLRSSQVLEPSLQLTDFNDSALAPALSPDGRMLTFIRGGGFGDSAPRGQIYVKILPKGEPVQLTHDQFTKEQPVFSPDGARIVYTAVANGFKWDSWQVPALGGFPQPFLANASGLVWLDDQHMLYSSIMEGLHMGIVTSGENGADRRDIYYPRGQGSMAHRSWRSPDHKSMLVVEMDGGGWSPCRLLPFDGSSMGRPVGPQDAQCTTAAWSPDGKWMYFSSNAGGAFHVWRQRYPGGMPEQITTGPTEQEGTAISSDGKYLITSMGLQQGEIWIHDAKGDRALTSEGFAMLPTMAPSGDRVYYMMRGGSRAFVSGELWSVNVITGEKERVMPGRIVASYGLSRDGKKVVFTTAEGQNNDGIWIADLDRRSAPRQLTHGREFRAFFGAPGQIVYMNQGEVRHLYKMKEDGSENQQISPDAVSVLISVSPDGNWVEAQLPQSGNTVGLQTMFFSTRGEAPFLACRDGCSLGFGPNRTGSPLVSWSLDGKFAFVSLKFFGRRTNRTVVLPYKSGVPLETLWPKGLKTEQDVPANPGGRVINEGDAFPAGAAGEYLFWKRTTLSNLYRIPLPN
jgi:Tol biopolymer transport system component/predicted Ser/Thr protein kinase